MEIARGTLAGFDSGTYLAAVRLDGSGAQALSGVPVSRAIPSAEMIAGRTVLVYFSSARSAAAATVIAVTA